MEDSLVGTPTEEGGTPTGVEGTLTEEGGIQTGVEGTPTEEGGIPTGEGGKHHHHWSREEDLLQTENK